MTKDKLIQSTIEKIKEKNIKPEPRWRYYLKKYSIWILFLGAIFLAAISFSAGYDNVHNLDWDLHHFAHQNKVVYFLSLIPYLWVILFALFFLVAFFEVRRTEAGYRYSYLKIFALLFGSAVLFVALGASFGWGNRFNSKVSQNFPAYSRHFMMTRENQWMRPEEGFLAGTILNVSRNAITIQDLNGAHWEISLKADAIVRPLARIETGEMIKIIGRKKSENGFEAQEIRPWNGRNMNSGGNGRGGGMHMRQN